MVSRLKIMNLLEDYIVVFGTEDWVDVRIVAYAVAREFSESPDGVRELSMEIVSDLIRDGEMVAGDLGEEGFEAWEVDAEEAIRRVDQRWRELGDKLPGIDEVAWLDLTNKGEKRAANIDQSLMLGLKAEQVE